MLQNEPSLLIVILNWRTHAMTLRAVEAALIASEGLNAEITIVDNDSQDGSFEAMTMHVAGENWPNVRVLQSGCNGGFGAGNNVGIHAGLRGSNTYTCTKQSDAFRDLALEVDFCASVAAAPTLPSYNTTWHSTRPGNVDERVLTIEEAYLEAGIEVTIDPNHTVIDDSAAGFSSWSTTSRRHA